MGCCGRYASWATLRVDGNLNLSPLGCPRCKSVQDIAGQFIDFKRLSRQLPDGFDLTQPFVEVFGLTPLQGKNLTRGWCCRIKEKVCGRKRKRAQLASQCRSCRLMMFNVHNSITDDFGFEIGWLYPGKEIGAVSHGDMGPIFFRKRKPPFELCPLIGCSPKTATRRTRNWKSLGAETSWILWKKNLGDYGNSPYRIPRNATSSISTMTKQTPYK